MKQGVSFHLSMSSAGETHARARSCTLVQADSRLEVSLGAFDERDTGSIH